MAARKRKVQTVADEGYSKLEEYCIWLNEYKRALRKAGFSNDDALWLISTKESYPDWINGVTHRDIVQHLEDEED
jgi:hypothetical protein